MNYKERFKEVVDQDYIYSLLEHSERVSDKKVDEVLEKSKNFKTLSYEDIATLLNADEKYTIDIIEVAKYINESIHGKKITFYGVSYITDFCVETCRYCGDNIYSHRKEWNEIFEKNINIAENLIHKKRVLSKEEFKKDLESLLEKYSKLKELCILTGNTPTFDTKKLIEYLKIIPEVGYKEKIILNVPPLPLYDFRLIREALKDNVLHFRVFQESYDLDIYEREHPEYDWNQERIQKMKNTLFSFVGGIPPKRNFEFRLRSQERALLAGFEEVGFGVLFGLNDKKFGSKFEILALRMHADYIYNHYGFRNLSISFPRILPSVGVNYQIPKQVEEEELKRLIAITRIAIPYAKLIITCRESAGFRREIRSLINIEDFEARPGPGGNICSNSVLFQMEIQDRRKGVEILEEIKNQGYEIE